MPEDTHNQTTEIPPNKKAKLPMSLASDKPKNAIESKGFNMAFSQKYNLNRMSPEKAAAVRKQLELEEEK